MGGFQVILSIFFVLEFIAAFILSFILIASGGKLASFADLHILKLSMTNIGNGTTALPFITLNNEADVASNLTRYNSTELGLKDFYSIYVSNTCSSSMNSKGKEKIQSCTKRALHITDLPTMIEKDLQTAGSNLTLEAMDFPTREIKALSQRYEAMSVLYYISIAMEVLCVVVLCLGVAKKSGVVVVLSMVFAMVPIVGFLTASSIGSFISNNMRKVLNDHLKDIGITATRTDSSYLGATWFLVLSSILLPIGLMIAAASLQD